MAPRGNQCKERIYILFGLARSAAPLRPDTADTVFVAGVNN